MRHKSILLTRPWFPKQVSPKSFLGVHMETGDKMRVRGPEAVNRLVKWDRI